MCILCGRFSDVQLSKIYSLCRNTRKLVKYMYIVVNKTMKDTNAINRSHVENLEYIKHSYEEVLGNLFV